MPGGAEPKRAGDARLLAELAAFERATAERVPAGERLREALGHQLAHTLVFALSGGGRRRCAVDVDAAA